MNGCLGKIALGIAIFGGLALGGCAVVMSTCAVGVGGVVSRAVDGIDTQEFVDAFGDGVSRLGTLVLAGTSNLDGELERSDDGYTGTYRETCSNTSGDCALFGGTVLEGRTVVVRYDLSEGPGSVRLVLRGIDGETVVARAGEAGEQTLELPAGSNYLCLETRDYTGSVDVEVSAG